MTKKVMEPFILWLFFIICFGTMTFFTGNPMIAGIMIVWVLIPLLTFGCNIFLRKKLEASVKIQPTASKSEMIVGSVRIKNNGWFPALKMYCVIQIKNRLTRECKNLWIATEISPKSETRREFFVCSEHCGQLDISIEKLYLLDWIGFLPVKNDGKANAHTTVLPNTFASEVHLEMTANQKDDAQSWSESKKGNDPSEIFALRDYVMGDSLKQIHWKLSAKRNQMIVREASMPIEKSLLIFWDKNLGVCTPEETDAIAECAASVGQNIISQGISFVLGWTDGETDAYEVIDQEEQLLQNIPRMLKNGAAKNEGSKTTENLLPYSKVLLFAADIPEKNKFLCEDITLFLCGNRDGIMENTVFFGKETYQEDLGYVEI